MSNPVKTVAAWLRNLASRFGLSDGRRTEVIGQILGTAGVFCAAGVMAVAVGQYTNQISITVDGVSRAYYTQREDAQSILVQHFVDIDSTDEVLCAYDEEGQLTEIVINSAFAVNIAVDGETKTVYMHRGTAADALRKADVRLDDLDKIDCEFDAAVEPNMTITVKRVDKVTTVIVEELPYETTYRRTSLYGEGVKKVERAGVNGEKTVTTTLTYMDGELIDTKIKEKVTKKSTSAIVVLGSDDIIPISNMWFDGLELDSNGLPTNYKKVITGVATAYGANDGSKTSTGVKPGIGYIAVNPDVIPYGTRMYIVSSDGTQVYGCAIAADCGPSVLKNITVADLFLGSEVEIWKWGRRSVDIYILG